MLQNNSVRIQPDTDILSHILSTSSTESHVQLSAELIGTDIHTFINHSLQHCDPKTSMIDHEFRPSYPDERPLLEPLPTPSHAPYGTLVQAVRKSVSPATLNDTQPLPTDLVHNVKTMRIIPVKLDGLCLFT